MGITGVYQVSVIQFDQSFDMELHIKQNRLDEVVASLKDRVLSRSFYNGRTIISPEEKESHNFIFYNAQIDNYVDLKPTVAEYADKTFTLVPPGGYHIGGVEFAGTVLNDMVVGTIKFKNGLISSVCGKRIEGEPVVKTSFRTDGLPGINRYCTCQTASCTHRGFCDSCHLFNSLHASMYPGEGFPVEKCMMKQYEKYFGPMKMPEMDEFRPKVEHGPHHLEEE